MSLPNGIYKLSDVSTDRSLSQSGVKPGTGAGTQLVMLTEEEGTPEGFSWKLQHDASQNAYTLQHAKSGSYVSFEGVATENAHLGAHQKPKYFELESQGEDVYIFRLKGSNLKVDKSPCIMYPPMIALVSNGAAGLAWRLKHL